MTILNVLITCIVVSLLYSKCARICISDVCLVSQLLYYSVLQCNERQRGSLNCLWALQLTTHRYSSIQHSCSIAKLGIMASQSAPLHLLTWIHSYICSLPKFFDSPPSLQVPPCTESLTKKPIAHLLALPHAPHPVLSSTVCLTDSSTANMEAAGSSKALIQSVQLKSGPSTKPWIFHVRCYL